MGHIPEVPKKKMLQRKEDTHPSFHYFLLLRWIAIDSWQVTSFLHGATPKNIYCKLLFVNSIKRIKKTYTYTPMWLFGYRWWPLFCHSYCTPTNEIHTMDQDYVPRASYQIKFNHLQCAFPEINMMPSGCLDLKFDGLCHWHVPVLSDVSQACNCSNTLCGHDA